MSAPTIIQRLFSKAARQRHRELSVYGELLLLSERPASGTGRSSSWQHDRRYVKLLERRARRSGDQRALEEWLFALLVSSCPRRFSCCETLDWAHAERLARTPWQRHLVRQGATVRAQVNSARLASERQLLFGQPARKRPHRTSTPNDRLQLIRCYTNIARRMLDLVKPLELEACDAGAALHASAGHEHALCADRRYAPASGPPPPRRVRTSGAPRKHRGGHGGSHPSAGACGILLRSLAAVS